MIPIISSNNKQYLGTKNTFGNFLLEISYLGPILFKICPTAMKTSSHIQRWKILQETKSVIPGDSLSVMVSTSEDDTIPALVWYRARIA